MTQTPPWQLSASDLAGLTRSGRLDAEEAVASAVERMRAVNLDLNAVVVDMGDAAIERARALDKARVDGAEPGPLHGVPVTIKTNVDQKGQATSNGLVALKDFIAPDDAPLVRMLESAGAVVIGRSNVPELSYRLDTDNPLHGRTHNPWGRHLTAGGSSGGAGSAVMAGMGALAHGSDIAGSLRCPAMANGGVTLKPGLGRVAAWNPSQKVERGMLTQAMSVQGLITRHARDLALAMPVIIQPDPHDPYHVPLPWQGGAVEEPLRVGFTTETFGLDLHPALEHALHRAREALGDAGYLVEDITPPDMRAIGTDGFRALMAEVALLMEEDIHKLGSPVIAEVMAGYMDIFPRCDAAEFQRLAGRRSHYARQWSLALQRHPLVLCPFMAQPTFGPDADRDVKAVMGRGFWVYGVNFTGLPAGYVSTGVADLPQGPVPVGVQIIGRRWREDLIVQAMAAIEDRLGSLCGRLWQQMG